MSILQGDEELLENTASERLTLDEEYRMQEEWKEDDKSAWCMVCAEVYIYST